MSSVCVLTPVVIASWPIIAAAVTSAASSMGFSVAASSVHTRTKVDSRTKVEVEIDGSVAAESGIELDQSILMTQGSLEITVTQDDRGSLSVCVVDESRDKAVLKKIGKEVAGRIVQQFAYNKLMTELRARGFDVVDQSVTQDQSIEVKVRMND